ncbi:ATP-dependent Clp protease ATP-binding subunit ClpA OS=Stutzerimonas stutzeri OX=316 GN=clpA PE=3 SV=1 [Stutzerimonas stutzeri]
MLNRELEVTLNLAFKEARAKRHEFMTVEHLLLALLDNEAAATVLRACGASLDKFRVELQAQLKTRDLGHRHAADCLRTTMRRARPCLRFRQIQRALAGEIFFESSAEHGANVQVAIVSEQFRRRDA